MLSKISKNLFSVSRAEMTSQDEHDAHNILFVRFERPCGVIFV